MEAAVVLGLSLGVGLLASLVLGCIVGKRALVRKKTVTWKVSLWLLVVMVIVVPMVLIDAALHKILDEVEIFLEYPKVVGRRFENWTPNPTNSDYKDLCDVERTLAIDAADAYEIPDISEFKDTSETVTVAMYAVAAILFGLALLNVLASYVQKKHKKMRKVGQALGGTCALLFGLAGSFFSGMGTFLKYMCDVYLLRSNLSKDLAWFVDPNSDNSDGGVRPWVPLANDFITKCNPPEDIEDALRPGALETSFDTARGALCSDLVWSVVGAAVIVIAVLLTWEIAVLDAVRVPKKSSPGNKKILKMATAGGLDFGY